MKAHRLLYFSTPGSNVIKKKKGSKRDLVQGLGLRVSGSGCRARGRQDPDPGERAQAAALSPPNSYVGVWFGVHKETWCGVWGRDPELSTPLTPESVPRLQRHRPFRV